MNFEATEKERLVPSNSDNRQDEDVHRRISSVSRSPYAVLIILAVSATNFITLGLGLAGGYALASQAAPLKSGSIDDGYQAFESTWNKFGWRTPYASTNKSLSDALWNKIKPSHGFIAVDQNWAMAQQWPKSSLYPDSSPPKMVYLLEGYHQMHCLTIIRKTLREAQDGVAASVPSHHAMHCFDELRQAIQCSANNLPLYTIGNGASGVQQPHKCQNWDSLREFAARNSACYSDVADASTNYSHFGPCVDVNDDGLPSMAEMSAGDMGPVASPELPSFEELTMTLKDCCIPPLHDTWSRRQ